MIVFVKKDDSYAPRLVRLGISDFDYTEVLSGLQPGEQVALLGPAVLQAQREQLQSRVRAGTGGGLQQQQIQRRGLQVRAVRIQQPGQPLGLLPAHSPRQVRRQTLTTVVVVSRAGSSSAWRSTPARS